MRARAWAIVSSKSAKIAGLVFGNGKPVVVYLKHEGYLDVPDVQRLDRDGVVSWINAASSSSEPTTSCSW